MRVKNIVASLCGLTLVAGLTYTQWAHAQSASPADPIMMLAPTDMKWQQTQRPDAMRASLRGDSAKGPFEFLSRYDGGLQLPLHFHNNDLRGLILSGTFVIRVAGQPPKELPSGSYFSVPGKTQHTDACKAGVPCILYFTGDAPLDRIEVH